MKDGKWITGLTPDLPLTEAARLVLPVRLQAVLDRLPLAIHSAAHDLEHVHQLRVATRRAAAAVVLFGDCLPDKRYHKLRRTLRSIRRAAGAARDCDVFMEMLKKAPALQPASAKAARNVLFGIQIARRYDAQGQLAAIVGMTTKLQRGTAKLNDVSFAWRDGGNRNCGDLAAERIASLSAEFDLAATPPPADHEDLHRLRILGKRLRYSMEVFAECFVDTLRERLYPAIEEMQEILGGITDAHVAAHHFIEIREHVKAFHPTDWPRIRKPVEQLLQAQRRILPRERKRFLKWLANWKEMTGESPIESLRR